MSADCCRPCDRAPIRPVPPGLNWALAQQSLQTNYDIHWFDVELQFVGEISVAGFIYIPFYIWG